MVSVLGWCRETKLFFYWFQDRNLLGDDENFKRGGEVKKWANQISRGCLFFFFIDQKFSHILFLFLQVPLCNREIPRIKLMTALLFWILHTSAYEEHWPTRYEKIRYLDTRRNNFKVFWTLIWILNIYFLILLPSLCVNTV